MYIDIHTHDNNEVIVALKSQNNSIIGQCLAIHPFDATLEPSLELLEREASASNIVAMGEMGLDYRKAYQPFAHEQQKLFASQIKIANRLDKPIIIHQVRALDDTLRLLNLAHTPVIFHGFSGSAESANRILKSGYYLSFGHLLIHSPKLVQVFRATPIDRIFLETDESTISIESLYHIAAQLLDTTVTDLEKQIEKNYNYVFMARENRTATR